MAADRLADIEAQVRFVYERSPDGNGLVLPNRDVLALVDVAKAARGVMTQMDYETPHHTRLRKELARLEDSQ